jgi:uncharacterized protein (DUF433 family)
MIPLHVAVHSDPDIRGGELVFVGTRVPFRALLDYLEAGDPLDRFLEHYPSVTRELAIEGLRQAEGELQADLRGLPHAHSA